MRRKPSGPLTRPRKPLTLLIDADTFAYTAARSNEETFSFEDDGGTCVSTALGDVSVAIERAETEIEEIRDRLGATEVVLAFSCSSADGWRRAVLPSYKENRTGPKPYQLAEVRAALTKMYPTFERPRLEADDIVGILATHPTLVPGRKVIVSIDKDLKTIPGWLFNPDKDTKPRRTTEIEADHWHMYQALVGDTTDGYRGCPGIGKVKAEKILFERSPVDMWSRVVSAFESKGLTEEDALIQARVARICRSSDYDFKTKEVKLWNPPVTH